MDNKLLNIKLDNEKNISNLDEVLKALENINNDLNSIEYIESLLNYLEFQDISNKDSLVDALKSKLLEFKSLNDAEMSSKQAIEQAAKYNEDLKRINVISTSKYDNDSKKDIEYISITHEDGSVEMLVCAGKSSIGEYIALHANDMVSKSADEIFKHFKETVHNELKFYNEQDIDTLNPNLSDSALVNDEDTKALEVEEVRKYASKNGLGDEVKVSIDPNGERIYIVADAIIKFHSNFSNERIMDILQEPTMKKGISGEYDALLSELNEPSQDDLFTKYESADEVLAEAKPDEKDEFEEIDFERIFPDFNLESLKNLIVQKEVYGNELTADELTYINRSIAFLIGSMLERAENNNLYSDEELTLQDYMKNIVDKYEAIKEGRMKENELSEIDKQLAEKYLENMEKINSLGLRNKPKMLELKNKEATGGLAAVIILLEIVAIAAFVLIFLSLDI